MKEKTRIVAIVFALVAGAVMIGWLYFRANPAAWDDFLAEMGAGTDERPAPSMSSQTPRKSGDLVASGNIEAEEVAVASPIGGRIIEITSEEGEEVAIDHLLLRLDQQALLAQREGLTAAVAQAQAAVDTAQAQLDLAYAGATEAEKAAAEAAVSAAQGAVMAAEAALAQAEIVADSSRTVEGVESSVAMAEASLAQAEGAVAAAEANVELAEAERSRLLAGARPEEIAMYQGYLTQANSQYLYVEDIHTELIDNEIGGRPEERARFQSDSARGARDAAQAQLDLARAGATSYEGAAATAAVNGAQAQLLIAQAGVDAAEAALAQAQAAPLTSRDQVLMADTGVDAAAAQLQIAQGQLAQAEAFLAGLEVGSSAEQIAVLSAQVAGAKAAQAAALASLKALDIELAHGAVTAPAGGVISERLVHAGELAIPGAPLFILADLDQVTLTVYVPEADLGRVALGQAVEVTVDSYDHSFAGVVSHIATQAEFTPMNVQTQEERVHMVFAVKVLLENSDHQLKPGMPADALFK